MLNWLLNMSDGFWGALIGAIISGAAGIIVVLAQLKREEKRVKLASKKEVKYVIYYLKKYVNDLNNLIKKYTELDGNKDKIKGYKIIGVDDYGYPVNGSVELEEGESIEILSKINENIEGSIIPKIIHECNRSTEKLKKTDLTLIEYKVFQLILHSFDEIELMGSKLSNSSKRDKIKAHRKIINNNIDKLESYI